MKKVLLSTAILLVFGCTLFLTGHGRTAPFGLSGYPGSFMQFLYMMRLWNDLDLSDEQIAALDELKEETEVQIEPLIEEIAALGVTETLLSDEIDTDTTPAQEKLDAAVDLQSQIATIVADALLEGSLILEPDQRQIVLEEIEKKRDGMGDGPGHWERRGFRR
jgi:hypothetical protein